MKLRIRCRKKTEVVQFADGNSLQELRQLVKSHFVLQSDNFELSLNGSDPICAPHNDTTLSDLGIVSGDLILLLCPQTEPTKDCDDPRPCTSAHASASPPDSSKRKMDAVEDHEPMDSETQAQSRLTQAQRSVPQAQSNLTQPQPSQACAVSSEVDTQEMKKCLKEAGLISLEDGAGLVDPEVNNYLRAPMLCREATTSQVPLVLSQIYSSSGVQNRTEALCVVVHVLMLELGLSAVQPDGATSTSSSETEKGAGLPAGWKGAGLFRCRYCIPEIQHLTCTITLVPIGPLIIIYGSLDGSPVCQLKLSPGDFVPGVNEEAVKTYQNLDRLSRIFKDNVGHTLQSLLQQEAGLPCTGGFEGLLSELKVLILQNLDAKSLVRLSRTCKHLQRVCRDRLLWKRLYLRDFGKRSEMSLAQDWYELYKDMYLLRRRMREQFRHMTTFVPPFLNRPNPLHPFTPYQPGFIGGEYDIDPLFSVSPGSFDLAPSSSLLPNPRFDPVWPAPENRFHRGRGNRDRGFRPRLHVGSSFIKMF